jgi:hypothetical protein
MANLDNATESAFSFAQEVTKQLITLSTAIIALTITFQKDVTSEAPKSAHALLEIAWVLYIVSLAFGILTLMSLTSNLAGSSPSINATDTRIVSALQIIVFVAALGFTVAFGFKAL